MFLGYNTNGFAHHRLEDAIASIGELGYGGVAITPDVYHRPLLETGYFDGDPYSGDKNKLSNYLVERKLKCVIETGARFILDPKQKHQPTLVSLDTDGRCERLAFLQTCANLAAKVNAECVSFWSGTPTDDATPRALMLRLVDGCKRLADAAAAKGIRLAFEPEPGMFIDTMDKFAELHARVNHPAFGLTLDIGHLVCNSELPVSLHLKQWKHVLWNVHVEDMKRGVHDHLMFGDGEVDFADVFAGLKEINYAGGIYVELSRHSHDAVNAARKSKAFLDRFLSPHEIGT
ncbi:MAG TPA: sugar phosphate isomerase/epimerase family protein [Gemmataceae bacterium]|jgi:sugar phosphate isomerase/epimerase